jgi:hypothetical protein
MSTQYPKIGKGKKTTITLLFSENSMDHRIHIFTKKSTARKRKPCGAMNGNKDWKKKRKPRLHGDEERTSVT